MHVRLGVPGFAQGKGNFGGAASGGAQYALTLVGRLPQKLWHRVDDNWIASFARVKLGGERLACAFDIGDNLTNLQYAR